MILQYSTNNCKVSLQKRFLLSTPVVIIAMDEGQCIRILVLAIAIQYAAIGRPVIKHSRAGNLLKDSMAACLSGYWRFASDRKAP